MQKRVADLDAQRAQEVAALEEGRARFATSRVRSIVPASRCVAITRRFCVRGVEVEGSREPTASADWTGSSSGRTLWTRRETDLSVWTGAWPGPRHASVGELSAWLEERHADLRDTLTLGDNCRVLELTSKLSEGTEHMVEITSGMMS